MLRRPKFLRRSVLGGLSALGLVSALPAPLAAQIVTPRQTEGPFYPSSAMRFADQDNDLVQVADAVREAGGEVIVLKGVVRQNDGAPAAGARIEIWQVDTNGRYLHRRDARGNARDPNFQGFGFAITDEVGQYAFRTIKPVPYPGRTPHIHVKVFHAERELTTQFYIHEHPLNPRDGLWRRLSAAQQEAVAMRFSKGRDGEETTVDIQL